MGPSETASDYPRAWQQREADKGPYSWEIYVLSLDNVQWLVDHYRNAWPFDTVIIDELSSFKNPQAKRFRAFCLVRNHIRRIYGLTGTPAPNGPSGPVVPDIPA